MYPMNLSAAEQERLAYIEGDIRTAELLAKLLDRVRPGVPQAPFVPIAPFKTMTAGKTAPSNHNQEPQP